MRILEQKVQIIEYSSTYQGRIEQLILPIQTLEFNVPITREEQPDLLNVQMTFQHGAGNFWVALWHDEVVGTIGIVDIGQNQVALKKMFVREDFRGKDRAVAASLMETAKTWCSDRRIKAILLGTVDGMKAAHRFYEKNGFVEIAKSALPESFPIVAVDTKFYELDLKN